MPADLTMTTVAFLATDGVEQVELTHPWAVLAAAGATTHLVSPQAEVQAYHHLDRGDSFTADRPVADANPATYDALVLPGGVANPDALRTDEQSLAFIRSFVDAGKVVAAVCHAPWTLIEVDAVRGRRVTSWPSLATDLRNAGAIWTDAPLVVDDDHLGKPVLITSRKPDDLPAFSGAIVAALSSLG
jgi:protease I